MTPKLLRIDDETRSSLLRARIDGNRLQLVQQLEPAVYQKVNKAIKAAGGKWQSPGRGRPLTDGCHVFSGPAREALGLVGDDLRIVNKQQTFQSFYTPPELAEKLAEYAHLERGVRVLEPSAGDGALCREIKSRSISGMVLVAVEINPEECLKLPLVADLVHAGDFLEMNLGLFDRVVMNPPFTRGQDVKHIIHALKHLKPGGRLVAICSGSAQCRKVLQPMADSWEELPAGTFKASGTMVKTVLLVIVNEDLVTS